jgi:putative ABC transport system permease protein
MRWVCARFQSRLLFCARHPLWRTHPGTSNAARDRFNMVLLSIFAGVALLLAAIGIYGVMAYAVQYRTHEIGVRVALGARPRDVRRMVLFEGGRLDISGVLFGIVGALALTPLLRVLLYAVKPWEPTVFLIASALLGAARSTRF